ncbi:hypothetical protein GSI_00593 [Ganoderma sinense ZZ0214-1]|uniref:Uncharacterized protein n=1 Tax=Ganoderma sinense ZZ0214-1 TaxID=1077348 RepID=A0A2G8ST68_9APHY|nr:hypothetical protein GSI_00593 [Ganoderma sinense ZZ0214-1]
MLATLPLLETFIIDSVPECSPVETIANLPELRLLEVRGSIRKTAFLLSHLRFPTSATISIGIPCGTCELSPAEIESLAEALHPVLQEEPLHTVNYAVFAPSNDVPVPDTCRAWAGEPVDADADQSQVPRPAAEPRLVLTGDGARALGPVLRSLDLSHIRYVDILGSRAAVGPLASLLEAVSDSTVVRFEEEEEEGASIGDVTEEAQTAAQSPQRPTADFDVDVDVEDDVNLGPTSGREALPPLVWGGPLLAPEGVDVGPKSPVYSLNEVGYRGGNAAGAGWLAGRWGRDDGHQNYRVRGGPACAACALTAEAIQYKLPPMLG